VKNILNGFDRIHGAENPEAEKLGTPFDLSMATKSKQSMKDRGLFAEYGEHQGFMQLRVFVSLAVGILCLMRISEHLQTDKNKGTAKILRKHHVTFTDKDNKPIPYSEVGLRAAHGVHVNTTHGKTDKSGRGRRNHHARQKRVMKDSCFVRVMEKFIMIARDEYGAKESDPLYDIPGLPAHTRGVMETVMNFVMTDLGMGVIGKFTSHSLRYGGATMLAAAGFPQYVIEMYGGWTKDSKSLRRYIKPSMKLVKMVSAQMAAMAQSSSANFFIVEAFMIAKSSKA